MKISLKVGYSTVVPPLVKNDNKSIICYIQANSLGVELKDWLQVNPRSQNMNSKIISDIKETLTKMPHQMHRFNSGILLLAKEVEISSQAGVKGEIMKVELENPEFHGIGDGGHTYRAILDVLSSTTLPDECYVKVEVLVGLNELETISIVSARNRSIQVDSKSLEDLNQSFEVVKEILADEPFKDRIEYRMNQISSDKGTKIDVAEIISLFMMFSPKLYPLNDDSITEIKHPMHFNKASLLLQEFLKMDIVERETLLYNIKPIAHDIFVLWDKIEAETFSASKASKKRFESEMYTKKGNLKKTGKTRYYETEVPFNFHKGYIYPILASFRALLEVDEKNNLRWKCNPIEVWESLKESVANQVAKDNLSANEIGKTPSRYQQFYLDTKIYLLHKKNNEE